MYHYESILVGCMFGYIKWGSMFFNLNVLRVTKRKMEHEIPPKRIFFETKIVVTTLLRPYDTCGNGTSF
jgi:hypothetical protein